MLYETQGYNNHRKFYYPHHFIFYPIVIILIVVNIFTYVKNDHQPEYLLFGVAFFMLGWLSFMMRQHYALNNQNRLIRLEMRLRYFELTNQRFETTENKLTFKQIAALRFASDDELLLLIQQAIKKGLTADQIKSRIENWQADEMRV